MRRPPSRLPPFRFLWTLLAAAAVASSCTTTTPASSPNWKTTRKERRVVVQSKKRLSPEAFSASHTTLARCLHAAKAESSSDLADAYILACVGRKDVLNANSLLDDERVLRVLKREEHADVLARLLARGGLVLFREAVARHKLDFRTLDDAIANPNNGAPVMFRGKVVDAEPNANEAGQLLLLVAENDVRQQGQMHANRFYARRSRHRANKDVKETGVVIIVSTLKRTFNRDKSYAFYGVVEERKGKRWSNPFVGNATSNDIVVKAEVLELYSGS